MARWREKRALVTRADSGIEEMTKITHRPIKRLAYECGADFIILDHDDWQISRHYRIMKFYDLFADYDRLISIDSDVLVMPHCPNPFNTVLSHCIASVYEDKGSRRKKRHQVHLDIQERFGALTPGPIYGSYINTGFAMFSKEHREIFTPINGTYWDGWGFDDAHLWYNIMKQGQRLTELPFLFNHMTMFSEDWNHKADRFKSYIIHYAGQGKFDRGIKNRMQQIRADYKKVYGKSA